MFAFITLFDWLLVIIGLPLAVYYLPIILSYLEGNPEGARRYKEHWKRILRFLRDGK
ncbi:MAG: hypothetical protein LWX07_09865 [Bacteroidetes bacterium]|nr:hypothetical protein [Bacteroidota bacterium]